MAEQKQEAKATEVKLAKVKVLRPFLNNRTRMIEGKIGSVVEVFASDVPELTQDFGGNFAFRGQRIAEEGEFNDIKRQRIVRAELVTEAPARAQA